MLLREVGGLGHLLNEHGLVGSMSRRGNPYDNAKAESLIKTLKVEAVYLADYETFEDVSTDRRGPSRRCTTPADCVGCRVGAVVATGRGTPGSRRCGRS